MNSSRQDRKGKARLRPNRRLLFLVAAVALSVGRLEAQSVDVSTLGNSAGFFDTVDSIFSHGFAFTTGANTYSLATIVLRLASPVAAPGIQASLHVADAAYLPTGSALPVSFTYGSLSPSASDVTFAPTGAVTLSASTNYILTLSATSSYFTMAVGTAAQGLTTSPADSGWSIAAALPTKFPGQSYWTNSTSDYRYIGAVNAITAVPETASWGPALGLALGGLALSRKLHGAKLRLSRHLPLFSMLCLSGCSALKRGPLDDLYAAQSTAIRDTYLAASRPVRANTETERNAIIDDLRLLIDQRYYRYEYARVSFKNWSKYAGSAVNIGLSTAGTLSGVESTKTLMSALVTAIEGSGAALDRDVLMGQTMIAIAAEMRRARARRLELIQKGMAVSIEKYPLNAALVDLLNYYYAGTYITALQSLNESSAVQAYVEMHSNGTRRHPKPNRAFSRVVAGA